MAYNKELTASRKMAIIIATESGNGDLIDIGAMSEMRRLGYVETRTIKNGIKGRQPLEYIVTGKGRSFKSLVERNAKRDIALAA